MIDPSNVAHVAQGAEVAQAARVARAARGLSLAASAGAGLLVPLLYVPALASVFALPKEIALEIAAALAFGGFALDRLARTITPAGAADPPAPGRWPAGWLAGIALVLASTALSAALAARGPIGAPYAFATLGRWAALFGIAAGAHVVADSPGARATLLQAVTTSAAVVSVIGLAQHVDLFPFAIPVLSAPGSTFGNRNIAGELVALSLPFALAAWLTVPDRSRRWVYGAALVVEGLYLGATRARGALAGAAVGVLLVALCERRRWSRGALAGALGLLAVAAIVALVPARTRSGNASDSKRLAGAAAMIEATFDRDSPAIRTRLGLWRRSVAMFRAAPVTGIGPGNWPVVFPRYAEPGAAADGVLTPKLSPRQAHNDALERLVETGVVGLGAVIFLAVAVGRAARARLRSHDAQVRSSTAAAVGATGALLAAGVTGFPLDMPGTLTVAGLALGLLSVRDAASDADSSPRRVSSASSASSDSWASSAAARRAGNAGMVLAALALIALAIVVGERRLRGNYWLGVAERTLYWDPNPTGASPALAALDLAEQANPRSFRVALRRAQAHLRLGHGPEAARAAEAALRQEPFSPNAWAALGAADRFAGEIELGRIAVESSLDLLHDFPLALSVKAHLAEAAGARAEAESAWARLQRIAQPSWPDRETSGAAQTFLLERARGMPAENPGPP